jgi:hypothetical protein
MAIIAQKIQTIITLNDEQIEELVSTEMSRTELEKRLDFERERALNLARWTVHGQCMPMRTASTSRVTPKAREKRLSYTKRCATNLVHSVE